MYWQHWLIAVLVVVTAAWMTYDGLRALIVGDYTTPKSGQYAGQLGPWSKVVEAVGIPPRSTLMKGIFVGYGLAFLVALVAFLAGASWSWAVLFITAVLGLWYIPFGTLLNALVIVILLLIRTR